MFILKIYLDLELYLFLHLKRIFEYIADCFLIISSLVFVIIHPSPSLIIQLRTRANLLSQLLFEFKISVV